jgi:methanogenic corrinoid protein MtbC1
VANLRSIYRNYFRAIPIKEKKEQKIIVCCVPGEEHEAGPELLSLYLRIKGWDVTFVGHSAPEAEILRKVEQDTPFALLLSVTLIHNLPALVSLTQRLRECFPSMKILAGGNALRNPKKAMQRFVDGVPDSFEECHRMLNGMVNIHA